jgi:hypothetical protein
VTLGTINDGSRTANLGFTVFGFPIGSPPTPNITSFAAAQSIDTTAPFQLSWNLSGGNSLDIVQLVITDAGSNVIYFASPAPFSSNALSGASTSILIPPETFPPGSNFIGHLSVARPGLPNTNSYPGAIGVPAVLKDTEFPLVTRPAPPQPVLEILSHPFFQLRCTGESNRNYHVQATPDLVTWADVLVTNSPSFTYTDTNSLALPQRFFRVRVGP